MMDNSAARGIPDYSVGSTPMVKKSTPLFLGKRLTFPFFALLALLAVGTLSLLPGGPLNAQAQEGAIEYAENGTGPAATFTATDPEGRMIYWSLLTVLPTDPLEVDGEALVAADLEDNDDFSISMDGVLTFNIPPDHEDPDDTQGNQDGDDDGENEYKIVVVATDDALGAGGTMGYMRVVVEVTDKDEPGMITLSSLQPQVGADLMATLDDPEVPSPTADGNNLTWKWEKSQDMSSWTALTIGPGTDMYTPLETDVDHYLRVTATYEDGDENERSAQVVSANMARAAPTTTDADSTFPTPADVNNRIVDENSPAGTEVGKPVAATDTSDDVLTYSLSGGDDALFEIDPATGQITVGPRTVLNHEDTDANEYMVTVAATEAAGARDQAETQSQSVTITVKDLNEAPMVTEGATMVDVMEDGTAVGTYMATDLDAGTILSWSVDGADKDKFEISNVGVLTFEDAPNYEMPADAGRDNVYNVTVVVTDDGVDTDGKNEMTAMREVVIMVTNKEEEGKVTLSSQQPKSGAPLTAMVTDPDGGVTGVKWQWYHDVIVEENLATNAIEGATSATYTPRDVNFGASLSVRAAYTDGYGKDSATAVAAHAVLARGDHEPVFPDTETGKRMISEGAIAGGPVTKAATADSAEDPVQATDGDAADILTYSLGGRDAGSFTITSDTDTDMETRGGQISVKEGTKLDRETKDTYMVTVTATDPGGLAASIDVTITVTDVNEAPEVMGDAEKDYTENGTRPVATYRATDPEGRRMVYWSLLTDPS